MKTIATANFRGGVGKTTITWLLAKYISEKLDKKVLVIDIDSQMNLTMSIELEEEKGILKKEFNNWYNQYKSNDYTIYKEIITFEKSKNNNFDFNFNSNSIFKINDHLFFIPSTNDLYWMNFDILDREKVRSFFNNFLYKLAHSVKYQFDYIFFDCPPNFSSFSYSVLSCANIILIPFNPNMLASKELILMFEGLAKRIQPWPEILKISAFMNKAKTMGNNYLTNESKKYLLDVKQAKSTIEQRGINIEVFDTFIPENIDIKSFMNTEKFPDELNIYFQNIWKELEKI